MKIMQMSSFATNQHLGKLKLLFIKAAPKPIYYRLNKLQQTDHVGKDSVTIMCGFWWIWKKAYKETFYHKTPLDIRDSIERIYIGKFSVIQ